MLLAKYFIYTNKLNGNNTPDLYTYLVLLKINDVMDNDSNVH